MSIEKIKYVFPNIWQEPVTAYEDNMTYVEFLMGILKKLNETISQVNTNSEWIAEFETKYADLTGRIEALENAVATTLPALMDEKIGNLRIEIEALISQATDQINANLNAQVSRLDTRIDNVAIGKINVIDPTTGISSPLQTVIDNLFDSSRENALTATEYDALDLTATDYDAYELSAYLYDTKGKTLLVTI